MKETIKIEALLDYINNELPVKDKEEVESFLIDNPIYFKVIKGLLELQKDFGSRENVLEYFKSKNITPVEHFSLQNPT